MFLPQFLYPGLLLESYLREHFQLRLHGNFTSAETSTSSSRARSCKVKKSSRKPFPSSPPTPSTGCSFAFQPFHPSPFTNRGERNFFLTRLMIYRWIRNEKLPKCVIFDVMHVPPSFFFFLSLLLSLVFSLFFSILFSFFSLERRFSFSKILASLRQRDLTRVINFPRSRCIVLSFFLPPHPSFLFYKLFLSFG